MYFPDLPGRQDQEIHGLILIMFWILGFKRIRLGNIDYFSFLFPDRSDNLALCKNGILEFSKKSIDKRSSLAKDVNLATSHFDQIQRNKDQRKRFRVTGPVQACHFSVHFGKRNRILHRRQRKEDKAGQERTKPERAKKYRAPDRVPDIFKPVVI